MSEELNEEKLSSRRAARERLKQDRQRKSETKAKTWAKEWGNAAVSAFIVAVIIRTFFFEAFRIPTPSMEKTLLVGDFLIVSKMHYGPRSPMSIGIPFTSIHIPDLTLPWFRIPGFSRIKRNDIVVFNYPVENKVISQKEHYIKRLVAMPGDTVSMQSKVLSINGKDAQTFPGYEQRYSVTVRERLRLSPAQIKDAGGNLLGQSGADTFVINMTSDVADKVSGMSAVLSVEPQSYPSDVNEFGGSRFPFSRSLVGNRDNLPSFVVPFKGQVVQLSVQNWPMYEEIIVKYEGNKATRRGETFIINGVETTQYTIKQNYYFMLGDNRDDSLDSRYWGFVPDDHIVGKASIVYFSWNAETMLPRFSRILSLIHNWD